MLFVICFWLMGANMCVVDGANIEIAEEVSVEAFCLFNTN
jgi:hypothetical protein